MTHSVRRMYGKKEERQGKQGGLQRVFHKTQRQNAWGIHWEHER